MMRKMTIKNNFTNRQTWIDVERPLNRRKVKRIRARLCSSDCLSGDDLGGRGPQDDPELYEKTLCKAWEAK